MAKSDTMFICKSCGYETSKWMGKCPSCNEWNSFEEVARLEKRFGGKSGTKSRKRTTATPEKLSEVEPSRTTRINTNISELNRSLGGGLVPGQVVLIAGEPGIGKSTLLLQLAGKLTDEKDQAAIYVSGEESTGQIKIRAQRLDIKNDDIALLEETDVDEIVDIVQKLSSSTKNRPNLIIIDSIQMLSTQDLAGMAGSVGQVRESTHRLVQLAKSTDIPLLIVGHVTKEGNVAGPATLAHMVDTVLWFEGSQDGDVRLLRSIKNRFGPTDEIGVFRMHDSGLVSVDSIDEMFVSAASEGISGSAITSVMEGTRPILVEIQSLIIPTKTAFPRRIAQGIDPKRLEVILAVLTKRCGMNLLDKDVFVNVVGGIKIKEPAADLAIALSIASAFKDKPVKGKVVAIGEIGLSGEIRSVKFQDKRIKEAKRLGYTKSVSSKSHKTLSSTLSTISA